MEIFSVDMTLNRDKEIFSHTVTEFTSKNVPHQCHNQHNHVIHNIPHRVHVHRPSRNSL